MRDFYLFILNIETMNYIDSQIVNCKISRRLERGTKHSIYGCESFFLVDALSNLGRNSEREILKRTISTGRELGLGSYKWYQS